MTISRVQTATGTYDQAGGNPTSVSATWPSATTAGNTLVAIVGISLVAGGNTTYSAPSGWGTSVARVDNASNCGLEVWVIENASSRSGSETFSISNAARDSTLHLIELHGSAGAVVVNTVGSDQTGSSTTADTGAVAPSGTLSLYRLAVKTNRNSSTQSAHTNSFTEFNELASVNATAGNRVNTSPAERIHTDGSSIACAATISTSRPWAAVQIIFAEEVAVSLTAAASGGGTATATLVRGVNVTASGSGGGSASASATRSVSLGAAASGSGVSTAQLTRHVSLSGASSGGGTGAANLARHVNLAAASSGGGSASGLVTVQGSVALTASGSGGGTGSASYSRHVNVTAAASGGGNGTAVHQRHVSLAGSSTGGGTASAHIVRQISLAASASGGGSGAALVTTPLARTTSRVVRPQQASRRVTSSGRSRRIT